MNIERLFTMQRELDKFIEQTQQIERDVFREKGLALLVELGELANETRCFKFWSTKGPSERDVILEEFVDSIHFILSLGIMRDLTFTTWQMKTASISLTEAFLAAQFAVTAFIQQPTTNTYASVWASYSVIAHQLNFTTEDITAAYIEKNKENYARQRNGY